MSALGVEHDPAVFVAVSVAIVVALTALQLRGLGANRWLTRAGSIGVWTVIALFAIVAIVHAARGNSATHFADGPWLATPSRDTALLWSTIVFATSGSEMLGFMRNEVAGGVRTVVRALALVAALLFIAYIAGTVAMLVILPKAELTRLSGLPDAIHAALGRFGSFGIALFALSSLGALAAWYAIAPRLPMEAGIDSFLPPVFAKRHPRTGAPVAAILLQGGLTLAVVLLGQSGATAAAAYDVIVSLTLVTATVPYVFVFVAYAARARWADRAGWSPPGGATTGRIAAVVGLITTLTAIAASLVTASLLKVGGSALGALFVGVVLFAMATRRRR